MVFTSGGTEADNLALKGIFWARRDADPRRVRILSTAIEHHAVLDPLHWLATDEGAEVELLPVDQRGRLDVDALRAPVERDPGSVALISVMWANNEVGTLQPIDEVVALAAEHGIPVHTDAVQAVGAVPSTSPPAASTRSASPGTSSAAPTASARWSCAATCAVTALVHGGGQERDIRSGTLDLPAIAGFAAAVEPAVKAQPEYAERVAALRDDLVRRVIEVVPDAHLHGDARPLDGTAPAARQRPPRLPRLRGRLAADAARRPRHRVLHRLGLLAPASRSRPTCCSPWAATTTRPATRCASRSATPPPPPTSTPSSRRSVRPSSAPGRPGPR